MRIETTGQRWKVATVILIASLITAACVGFVYLSYTGMQSLSQKWRYQDEQSFRQVSAVSDLFRHLGYGGFIHNFKNYVLRQDEKFLHAARSDLSLARDSIRILHQTDLTGTERSSIDAISATLSEYRDQLANAEAAIADEDTVESIDSVVRVDDTEALQAISALIASIQVKNRQARRAIDDTISDMLALLLSALFAIPVVLVAAFVSVNYIRRLVAVQGQLGEERRRLKVMMDSIEEGITMIDKDLKHAFINQRFHDITGFPEGVVYPGSPLEDAFRYDAERGMYGEGNVEEVVLERLRKARQNEPFEFTRVRPDGQVLQVRRHPIPDGGFVSTFSDVTARTNAEQALETAKQEAESANAAKSQFLANMSHEIRTPMNAIIGLSNIAMKGNLDDRTREHLEKVNESAKSLLGIINDILDFSKIEAGKLSVENVPFQLDDVLQNVSTLTGESAARKGVELLFWTDSDVPRTLKGDPLRLGQIITNLVGNSVKFTESGEIIVRIKNRSQDRNHVRLEVSVTDTGIGIGKDVQERLFNSFSQADSSTTRKYGGTGLGLTICRKLVELMDGSISVVSEPGEGSTFTFDVRLGLSETAANRQRVSSNVAADGLSVLIADDNATARVVLRHAIESLGFSSIDSVVDGQQAFEKAEQALKAGSPYDIILLDVQMPVCGGIEAFRRILDIHKDNQLPATFLITGLGRESLSEEERSLPLAGFLTKPINTSTMIDAFAEYMARGHQAQEVTSRPIIEKTEATPSLSGLNVLVAEDNEINQVIAREVLEEAGISVMMADNGARAMEMVAETPERFDIVLMDIQMPEMDGYEATRRIKRLPDCRNLPIIAMTAHAMAEERQRCFDAGMVGHVSKPIDPPTLYRTLSQWLPDDLRARDRTRTPEAASEPSGSAEPGRDEPGDGIDGGSNETGGAAPAVSGIDLEAAREKVGLKEATFMRLIGDFQKRYRDFPEDLKTFLDQQNIEEARRLVHTLAGLAGTFGFDDLRKESKAVEAVLKDEPVDELPGLDRLTETHRAVFAALDSELSPPTIETTSEIEPTAAEVDNIDAAFRKLDDHLASNRISARRILPEVKAVLGGDADSQYKELAEAVNGLNYADGRNILRRMARTRGIDLPK
jgi:signal transduction histidine kinase/response regulator RpfG family c-di-GMP phosphodiesterase/HPt (histidine-containing phosphotransfer) domain-containing protein